MENICPKPTTFKSESLLGQIRSESTRNTLALPSLHKNINDTSPSLPRFSFDISASIANKLKKIKKKLILDLDGTLFAVFSSPPQIPTKKISLSISGNNHEVYIAPRKGLLDFLSTLHEFYEIQLYTAGYKEFAQAITKEFEMDFYVSKVYHRDHCFKDSDGKYIKDLALIEADLSCSILIDDVEYQSKLQPLNTILVTPYNPEKNDDDSELINLIPFLLWLADKEDIRPVNEKYAIFKSDSNTLRSSSDIFSPNQIFAGLNVIVDAKNSPNGGLNESEKADVSINYDPNKSLNRIYLRRMKTMKSKPEIHFTPEIRKKIIQYNSEGKLEQAVRMLSLHELGRPQKNFDSVNTFGRKDPVQRIRAHKAVLIREVLL